MKLDNARAALQALQDRLGGQFMGWREDRGELSGWVDRSRWLASAAFLRHEEGFTYFSDLTAVDYLQRKPRFDVQIIVTHPVEREYLRLKTMVEEDDPTLDSLTSVWPGANWYEREVFDLFGIIFDGHPCLRRLLLPADYHGHPLRKDYPVTGPPTSVYR